jgi:hypothetical protein
MIVVILLYCQRIRISNKFSSFFAGEMFDSWTHAQSNLLFIAPDQRDFSFSTCRIYQGISLDEFIVATFAHKNRHFNTAAPANTVQLECDI